MSAIGTLLAALLGLLFALPAAGRFGVPAQSLARLLLNALRAVPELVWGALMVLAAGLGPNAGTLALALHTGGVLGRLFAEALENTPAQPAEALRLAGSGRLAAFAYGTLPGVWPQLVAYTLYRWENNIRMASVLGFVGAGGLGQMLYFSLSLFQQAQAATVILAMLVLVLGVDSLSAWRGSAGSANRKTRRRARSRKFTKPAEDRASSVLGAIRRHPPPGVQGEEGTMRKPLLSALLLGLLALGGCSLPQQQAGAPTEQRLGTQWGEGVASPVTSVALRRLSEQPVDRRQVFYSASRFDGRAIRNCPGQGQGGLRRTRRGWRQVRPRAAPQHPAIAGS